MPKRFLNPYIEKVNEVRQKLRRNEQMTHEEQVEAAAVLLTGGVMEQIPANQTYEDFTMPDGIIQKTICTWSWRCLTAAR